MANPNRFEAIVSCDNAKALGELIEALTVLFPKGVRLISANAVVVDSPEKKRHIASGSRKARCAGGVTAQQLLATIFHNNPSPVDIKFLQKEFSKAGFNTKSASPAVSHAIKSGVLKRMPDGRVAGAEFRQL